MSGEIELDTERRVDGGGLACIDVRPLIHEIHDVQVMLDYDLAKLYGVETKQLKRQVRRNIRRFPQEFMFELSENEMKSLRCQFGTSNRGGDRYGAYAFSEQGIAMLSAVLRSATAIETSIRIINAFGRQYGNLTKSTCGICHDRFIVVDRKELYSIGASLKDAGRLTFAVSKMGEALIPALLDSLRKATSAQVSYGQKVYEQ